MCFSVTYLTVFYSLALFVHNVPIDVPVRPFLIKGTKKSHFICHHDDISLEKRVTYVHIHMFLFALKYLTLNGAISAFLFLD